MHATGLLDENQLLPPDLMFLTRALFRWLALPLLPGHCGRLAGMHKEEGLLSHDTPVAGASAGSLIAACAKSGDDEF
eukprot:scaffold10961_cov28-Tisochrysis_lutea.AAC.1